MVNPTPFSSIIVVFWVSSFHNDLSVGFSPYAAISCWGDDSVLAWDRHPRMCLVLTKVGYLCLGLSWKNIAVQSPKFQSGEVTCTWLQLLTAARASGRLVYKKQGTLLSMRAREGIGM